MKPLLLPSVSCLLALLSIGCLTTPTSDSGGIGAVTALNTNASAITSAAQDVFAQSGYSMGPVNPPSWIAFEKPAGGFGKAMWGGFDEKTTIRVRLSMTPLPGTNNFRLSTRVYSVNDAGEMGINDKHRLSSLWQGQFESLLKKIAAQAGGAGPGY
ncbi:MAG: hypothetical protein ABI680_20670 [Chthoniobacteraceae bacterium]